MTRIFKIGSTKIVEDESMQGLSLDEVRNHLKTSFPEVAQAAVQEKTEGDIIYVEFLPKPGRKG